MSQTRLFTDVDPRFDGADYEAGRDHERLTTQLGRIRAVIEDGEWRTLEEIARLTDAPHASVSAQLRNLRKPRFGGCDIERRHVGGGLYEYRFAGGSE